MKKLLPAAASFVALAAGAALADDDDRIVRTRLIGYQEVPSVSTAASGKFQAFISPGRDFIDFELSYQGLQGEVRQAHIHFAQKSVNGAIVIWLCQTSFNPAPAPVAARVDTCPQAGTVRGRITAEDVLGPQPPGSPAPQQIVDGELDEVIAAIRAGVAYVNVHSSLSPGGEIRGQLGDRRGRGDHSH